MGRFIAMFILVSFAITACGESGISQEKYDKMSKDYSNSVSLGASYMQQADELKAKAAQSESKYAIMSSKYEELSKAAKATASTKAVTTTIAPEETQKTVSGLIELKSGEYIVGRDVTAGKYNVECEESGTMYVASNENEKYDILSEYPDKGETVYNNLNLKNGYVIRLKGGCAVKLTPVN